MTEYTVNYNVKYFAKPDDLAEYFSEMLQSAVESANKNFNLALSGGSTPKFIFKYLADNYRESIDWKKINFFWSDERCIPPSSAESNYRMAYEKLLSELSIPLENIFRIRGEDNPENESERYSEIIQEIVSADNHFPRFDLIMLGMGEDGHTASIFPNQLHLMNGKKICDVSSHPVSLQKRITFTGRTINNAKIISIIVAGNNKKKILDEIFNSHNKSTIYPVELIKPIKGNLIWMIND